GLQRYQTYSYDPFGNLTTIGGDPWAPGRSTPTSPATNRLTGGSYDGAGSLIGWQGNTYTYDAFGMMTGSVTSGEDRRFVYTAGDERFWTYRLGGSSSTWALRDLDGRVLREYEAHVNWATAKDYVYRDGQLLATSYPGEGIRHLHLDHLGTPRAVSGSASPADGFYTLTPCRVLDTRNQGAPVQAGETRIVPMAGACGIPATASAVAINLTVVDATERGEMTAMPATAVAVPVSTVISYPAATTRANNAVLKLGNGALAFYSRQSSGSAHLIVDVNGYFVEGEGAAVAYHAYFPFGEELTSPFQDSEQMKFTGHERDLNNLTSVADDLDYMHARHCSPLTARFLSTDRIAGVPSSPQTWNRYAYVRNNPLKLVDPDGLYFVLAPGLSKADSGFIKRALAGVVRRPFGRSIFQNLAADPRPITLTIGTLNKERAILEARKRHTGTLVFGQTTFLRTTITLDRPVIQEFARYSAGHADARGITTMAHELFHADKALNATFAEFKAGDQPTNDTGPAQLFGESVYRESRDLSMKAAAAVVGEAFSDHPFLGSSWNLIEPFLAGAVCLEGVCSAPMMHLTRY
ncbi:MAG: RHS repeat-associated core domain-containing protein, partial [Candidatus Methylomirabilaceae bacterium]